MRRYGLLATALLLSMPSVAVAVAEKVKMTSYYIPGLVDSPTEGIMVEMLQAIEKQSDLEFELNLMPTARVQRSFVAGKIYSYFPELEEFRPIDSCRTDSFMKKAIIAVNLKDKPQITSIEQLEGLKVGAVTGFSYGLDVISNENIELIRVDNDKTNLKKLFAGRIDAIVGDIHSTVNAINELDVADKLNFDIAKPIDLLDVFFVFPKTEQGNRQCLQVSTALKQLRINGDLFRWFGYR